MSWKCAAALLFLGSFAWARQDQDSAEVKKRIMDRVRERLAADRAALLKRVEQIIDEELAKEPAAKAPPKAGPAPAPSDDPKVKEMERKLRILQEQEETMKAELARAKREAEDEPLKKDAKKNGPHDANDAQEMFDQALELHEKDKNYGESIKLFKKIYYNFPETSVGATSAYNVACGYALWGKKEEALDWLEVSVKKGFAKIDHLRKDPDLDSLREEKRYKKLLADR
jgi:tetratricopeptide (TPR) repeat protein